MQDLPYRVPIDMAEAADRVAGMRANCLSPWVVPNVTPETDAVAIVEAYHRLCRDAEAKLDSISIHEAVCAEERIRNYTAALMVLASD